MSFYLSPLSLSLSLSLSLGVCCQALPEQWGCQEWWMDDDQPSAVFHSAPGRFTGPLTNRHENQSLFLILPFLPPSMPGSLLPSHSRYFNISSVTERSSHNGEMCAKQHWNLCVDRGKLLLLRRDIVDVSEWNSVLRVTVFTCIGITGLVGLKSNDPFHVNTFVRLCAVRLRSD